MSKQNADLTAHGKVKLPWNKTRQLMGSSHFQNLTKLNLTMMYLKVLEKWWKILFISSKKFFSFWRYLNASIVRSCRKNSLIRNIRIISQYMTSQPGKRTITMHILPNNSGSKSKQGKTFGQVIYNKRNKFLRKMRQAD